jgi:hypothetical protein
VLSRRVVNGVEYESAVEMSNALRHVVEDGYLRRLVAFLAGLIGQERGYVEPQIEISPLQVISTPSYKESLILIGGPAANKLSEFYLRDNPHFKFDGTKEVYQLRDETNYRDIEPSIDVAIIEKRIFRHQIVIVAHGFGE